MMDCEPEEDSELDLQIDAFGNTEHAMPPPPPGCEPSSTSPTAELARLQLAISSTESHGVTTIYDLPGVRTITSSKLMR